MAQPAESLEGAPPQAAPALYEIARGMELKKCRRCGCMQDAPGHRAADAFLQLKERGVDANMRVLESASWRPILKNLTLLEVARFRERIEVVNLVGRSDLEDVLAAVRRCAQMPAPALRSVPSEPASGGEALAGVERIRAQAPKQLRLDRAGFFIVLPQPQTGLIVCEHYENSGRLAHVIEGRQAALIAATVLLYHRGRRTVVLTR
jgi:tetrahydromethanopterin S-methyltransferase subunit A